jgi:hypothetical protein
VITTPDLIESLVANAAPVRRLRPPLARAVGWLLFALLVLALVAVAHGLRPDLELRLQQPVFLIGIAAALLTGALAAIATFIASVPDRSRLWLLLPVPAALAWFSTIGYGCLTDWVSIRPDGISLGETARCFATFMLVSAPLSFAMLVMLRYSALVAPTPVAVTGSLAVAAMTATALSLFHPVDATAIILMWNLGTASLLVALGRVYGGRMFSWVAPRWNAD